MIADSSSLIVDLAQRCLVDGAPPPAEQLRERRPSTGAERRSPGECVSDREHPATSCVSRAPSTTPATFDGRAPRIFYAVYGPVDVEEQVDDEQLSLDFGVRH